MSISSVFPPPSAGPSERKMSPSPPHPSPGPTVAPAISPVPAAMLVEQPLKNGTEPVPAGPSYIPTLSVTRAEVKDHPSSPIDLSQGTVYCVHDPYCMCMLSCQGGACYRLPSTQCTMSILVNGACCTIIANTLGSKWFLSSHKFCSVATDF